MWESQETPKRKREFRKTAARKWVSLLISLRGKILSKATREAHRDLRWFREKIPYVHRSVSEEVSLSGKSNPKIGFIQSLL
ncbi:hypothetical protein AXF42_Ash000045 [Apostasia shenzhenica]|uniref:Uncharacterized protein n=1 Tax=Apostasia shenzhenica TaxID=1088818 RepID=A0A2I0AF86_9ASPA|nr:hypothetical protein AXF42_Ash000045 [Apostasia shenzhenica]